jgi:hypothetical protein
MKKFTSIKTLFKYIEPIIQYNLEKIAGEIKDVLKNTVQIDWYNSHTPKNYERTNQLIDSISVTKAEKINGGYRVEIYFDESKILPQPSTKEGYFPAHMNITDGENYFDGKSYGELLPQWIEYGQNSSIHSYEGVRPVGQTRDWVEEDKYIKNRLAELLENKGYSVIIH